MTCVSFGSSRNNGRPKAGRMANHFFKSEESNKLSTQQKKANLAEVFGDRTVAEKKEMLKLKRKKNVSQNQKNLVSLSFPPRFSKLFCLFWGGLVASIPFTKGVSLRCSC